MKKLLALILAVLTLTAALCGCGFSHDGVPFIVAYIVMEAATDETKCAEMKGYVDEMVNTVRAAQ